jgi:hypothetical protein
MGRMRRKKYARRKRKRGGDIFSYVSYSIYQYVLC